MSVVIILVAISVICLLKLWPKIKDFLRIVKFSKSIKGPGQMELMKQIQRGELLSWLRELGNRYGSKFNIWIGSDLLVFLTDPEDIKHILGNHQSLSKSIHYKSLEPWLGKGLLISSGELWHTRRKMLTPAFHFKMLGQFQQSIEDNCKIFIEKLEEKANGEAFNIYPFITLLALDIICETAMGIKQNAQIQSTSEYVEAVEKMCRISHEQCFSIWRGFEFLFRFTEDFKIRKHALDILHGETNRVIEMRRRAFKTSNIQTISDAENIDESGFKKRLAFLDILLLAKEEGADLTDVDIREEVDTIMFGGHDTTSSALSFVIYLLSQHQAEQQKAYEEAVSLRGKEKVSMKYLEAVIKESLRLYPPGPMFSRLLSEDVYLRDACLPKGISVSCLAYLVHRNAKYFPEPDQFKPERFLVDESKLHPYAFISFSAGPRNCIGQKFAMLELKCMLANILRAYELLPVEGFVPIPLPELVLKSKNGIQVRLRKR